MEITRSVEYIRDNDKFILIGFIQDNISFNDVFFHHIVDLYNEIEDNDSYDNTEREVLKLSNNDFDFIKRESRMVSTSKYSRREISFVETEKLTFSIFKDKIQYLIDTENSDSNTIIFNNHKLKEFITNELSGFVLENPFDLSNSLNLSLKDKMEKTINFNDDLLPTELSLMTFLNTEDINDFCLNKIDDRVCKKVKNEIRNKTVNTDVNTNDGLKNLYIYNENIYKMFKDIVHKLPYITESLEDRTKKILIKAKKERNVKNKKNIINNYLTISMKTLSKFYEPRVSNTIISYVSRINNLFNLLDEYISKYNINHKDLQELSIDWKRTYEIYNTEIKKLTITIKRLTNELKEKEEMIIFQEKAENIFKNFIPTELDSNNVKEQKIIDYLIWDNGGEERDFKEEKNKIKEWNIPKTSFKRLFSVNEKRDNKLIEELLEINNKKNKKSLSTDDFEKLYLEEEKRKNEIQQELKIEEEKRLKLISKIEICVEKLKEIISRKYPNVYNHWIKVNGNEYITKEQVSEFIKILNIEYRSKELSNLLVETFKDEEEYKDNINYILVDRKLYLIMEEVFVFELNKQQKNLDK